MRGRRTRGKMGIGIGGTEKDLALANILIEFEFEPKGTKKSLDEICKARGITGDLMKNLCGSQADLMAVKRFMKYDKEGKWVFSKTDKGEYFWKEATFRDKCMHYLMNIIDKYS